MTNNYIWKSQEAGYRDSLLYIQGRMEGKIRSYRTPWDKLNDATVDGLEWHSMTVLAGRPGTGKTMILDEMISEGFRLNPGEDFRVLRFDLETMARTAAIRKYSHGLGRPYKYICSAAGKMTKEDLEECARIASKQMSYPIDIVEDPVTVSDFKEAIIEYMEAHSSIVDGKKVYKKTVVSLDHTWLLKRVPAIERDKLDTLYHAGEAITFLKKKYPIVFIILSQLNRNMDIPERNEDGKYGNYILESDIFGADALLQHADTVIGINRPGARRIKYYGPERYIIDSKDVLVWHFLKVRNGDTRMSFFKGEYERMRVVEIATPATQHNRKLATS